MSSENTVQEKARRGFAAMDPSKVRAIAARAGGPRLLHGPFPLNRLALSLPLIIACASEIADLPNEEGAYTGQSAAALTRDRAPDGALTIKTARDFKVRRGALLTYIWGQGSLPTHLPARLSKGVSACNGRVGDDCNPLGAFENLRRVDNIFVAMELGERSVAHHFIPTTGNGRLVIVHHGHGCSFGDHLSGGSADTGEVRLIESLVKDGFAVLGMYMPRQQPGNCDGTRDGDGYGPHDHYFKAVTVASGSVLKFYVEPIAVALNYLRTSSEQFGYVSYDLVGLSGGGWTTTLYAAIDPTIEVSVPVAGSLPLFMRKCEFRTNIAQPPRNCNWGYDGDSEQTYPAVYGDPGVARYLDLYALGAQGEKRRQIQILNRRDSCCFGELQFAMDPSFGARWSWDDYIHDYARSVEATVARTKAGSFAAVVDDMATKHEISSCAITNVILPALERSDAGIDGDAYPLPSDAGWTPDVSGKVGWQPRSERSSECSDE